MHPPAPITEKAPGWKILGHNVWGRGSSNAHASHSTGEGRMAGVGSARALAARIICLRDDRRQRRGPQAKIRPARDPDRAVAGLFANASGAGLLGAEPVLSAADDEQRVLARHDSDSRQRAARLAAPCP